MEVLGVSLAIFAIVLALGIEAAKRPRLAIRDSPFVPSGPVAWTFAAVRIYNRPLPRVLRGLLTREMAQGCAAEIDFLRWDSRERAIPTVPGRWSSHAEPLRSVSVDQPTLTEALGGAVTGVTVHFDPSLDPRAQDVSISEGGEEMAIAILTREGAYAWGTESYAHPGWAKPEWKLERGTYRVVVRVEGSGISAAAEFKLEYLSEDFARFRLQPL